MANGDNRPRDYDEDDFLRQQRMNTVRTPAERLPTTPAAQTGYTAAQVPPMPTTPAAPKTRLEHLREDYETLYGKAYPEKKTGWGRFGQVMGTIGEDVGMAVAPEIMARMPGTQINRQLRLGVMGERLGEEEQREAARQEAKERTGLERERLGFEEQKYNIPEPLGGELGQGLITYKDRTNEPKTIPWEYKGRGIVNWPMAAGAPPHDFDEANRKLAEMEAASTLPATGAAPPAPPQGTTAAPPAPPMPQTSQAPAKGAAAQQPITGGIPTITPAPPAPPPAAAGRYGKLGPTQLPMSPQEIAQQNAVNADFWKRLNPREPFPQNFMLGPEASKDDAARVDARLKDMQSMAATLESRKFNQELARDREQREREAERLRQQAADEKMVRAVDRDGRFHFMSQGDFDAHADEYQPHPLALPGGEYDKAVEAAKRVNEMQARMNGMAEAAAAFNWKDSGQASIVSQLVNTLNSPSWIGRTLGIDPLRWLDEQFLNKPGASGATPQTRNYINNLLSLREAMLALPKEITSGSRMTEQGVAALYATLPSGWTPNYGWVMSQLRLTQQILDRDRGTAIPIIDAMLEEKKAPELHRYSATSKDGKRRYFSDDQRTWIDQDGNRVEKR